MTQTSPPERYTILRELGRGAIGTVYAARDGSTGAVVALKILDPALFSEANEPLAEAFLNNARSAAGLRHRNIVRVFDAGEAGGTAYVAMELVEGESLRRVLDHGPLSIARAVQIFDDIASALAYAHEERMVHRGLKPSNIIVAPSGVAKIGDFGTGQIGEAALRYMSPEQVRRDPADSRSDLFSLGAVFYEMLTRRAPFEGDSPEQIRQNILRAAPPPPSTVNPHVPSALDAIVSRLLAPRPDHRFANARDLLRDLQRLEDALGLRPAASAVIAEPTPSVRPIPDPPVGFRAEPSVAEDFQQRIAMPVGEAFHEPDARFMEHRGPRPEPSSGSRIASFLAALALVLAVLSVGLTVLLHYSPDVIERLPLAIGMQEAPRPVTMATPAPLPAPVTEAIQKTAAPETATPRAEPEPVPPVPLVVEPSPAAQVEPEQPAIESEEPAPDNSAEAPQAGGTAKLVLAVSPRGELYIDGEHHGTTPPVTTLDLEPGMHRIEIRSGSRKPYLTYVTVKAGDERRIRHDFSAKPGRPPR